ncbi:unnamed protein product [Arctia plantaginis]|uniref:Uncharacterized protein n=1 Tax=Arctia plantaginis TaxID=874455 RepID=A0A8S1AV47_ARCPL|nr:unnamed protein product [Arctia plantaginis]
MRENPSQYVEQLSCRRGTFSWQCTVRPCFCSGLPQAGEREDRGYFKRAFRLTDRGLKSTFREYRGVGIYLYASKSAIVRRPPKKRQTKEW